MKSIVSLIATIFILTGCNQPDTKYTIIQESKKDGVLDQNGYVTVKPSYKKVFNFDGSDSFYNHPHFINLHWLHNDTGDAYAIVQNIDGKYGIINPKGDLLLKPIFDSISYFFDGYARVEIGGKYGLINGDFEVVLKPTYDEVGEFADNIAIVQRGEKYGCINRDMELKIKPTYDRIYFQQENFLRTEENGKWGFLDNNCEVLSKPIYDYVYDFSNGKAKVQLDGKIGYLNKDGKLITKQIYTNQSASF